MLKKNIIFVLNKMDPKLLFAIYARKLTTSIKPILLEIIKHIIGYGGGVVLYKSLKLNNSDLKSRLHFFSNYEDFKNISPDYILSIGGDGTLLDTLEYIQDTGTPVLGINVGRLGFLSSVTYESVFNSIQNIINKNYNISPRSVLQFKILNNHPTPPFNYALNDVIVSKRDSNSMITIHTKVNNIHLNSYWADGLIIATPTGSTAYSLSCLGPILTPDCQNLIINPIAPHNLSMRPIIIPDDETIHLKVEGRNKHFMLTYDSHTISLSTGTEINVSKASFSLNMITFANNNFFEVIQKKLHWGNDIRN